MFHFRKVFYTLDMMGVERVIHIPPPGDAGVFDVFRSASETLGYQVFSAGSVQEAESIIDKGTQFLKA
jgi:hypothetical protein